MGNTTHSRPLDLTTQQLNWLCGDDWEQKRNKDRMQRFQQQAMSKTHVNNPSSETSGKTKAPHSHVGSEKKKDGRLSEA